MAVNKVVINTENGAETIVDLTSDTVTPQTLAEGAVAHDASGNAIKGAMPTTSVLYTQQTLTNEQRTQARYNIDALGASDVVNNLETFSPERPLSAEQGATLANSINAASEQLLNEIEILADHKADKSTVTEEINTAIKKIPVGDGTTAGITKVYPSAECTTYTSETGTCTPAAVKKAVTQFGFPASGGNITGHIYLTGSKPSSSTGNTTQVVFGTSSEQHLALSSNTGMLVLNPNTSTTTGQILLKLGGASSFPKGIQAGGVSPMSNNGSNLGTTSLKWNNVYATTFNGSLSGNATSATKATQDGNGNTITSTYETKADAVARSSQLSAKINEITPIRGEDYWTEEDVENILGEANTLIADEMAKKDQLKPEFANSIEECTDPDKLYVLPDNQIYGYMRKETANWTNAVSTSIESDGSVFGYADGYYVSEGTAKATTQGTACTGCIPYAKTSNGYPTIYIKGLPWKAISHSRIQFLTREFTVQWGLTNGENILNINGTNTYLETNFTIEKKVGDTWVSTTPTDTGTYWRLVPNDTFISIADTKAATSANMEIQYVRMSLYGKGADLIISLDNPIEATYDYGWHSTGHEFVSIPTDNPIVQEIIKDNVAELRVKPEFVDNVEECIDTDKVYVLPDGYIYSHSTGLVNKWTNAVTTSTDAAGNIYNGVGYKNKTYVTSESIGWADCTQGAMSTGLIPYARKADRTYSTIYIKGLAWDATNSHSRMYFVAPTLQCPSVGTSAVARFDITGTNNGLDQDFIIEKKVGDEWVATTAADTGTYWRLTPNESFITDANRLASGTYPLTYLKISLVGDGANLIISLDEPIEPTIETSWRKTQCTFAPADYEDRIIENENKINDLNRRVSIVEAMGGGSGEGVESYVQEEAERVALEVYKHQNANTFTFLAISDMHYHTNNAQIIKSNIHAGQGMDLVRKGVNVDFAVCLGDNAWGSGIEGDANRATIELGIAEIRGANKCIDAAFRGIPNIRTVGNHDPLGYNYSFNNNDWLDGDEIFPLYGAYNRGAVYPADKKGGYCYRDFEDWKLRVICVNTTEDCIKYSATPKDTYVSPEQIQWFAQAIDLSAKTDASEWSILIFSHQPLEMAAQTRMVKILEAYINGTSITTDAWEGKTVTYSYSGKNAATIIGNIHGHNHNFQVDNLRKYVGSNKTEPISVKRICVPNACYSRSNERGQNGTLDLWDIEYGETTTYNKTPNSATDTAFNVFTIDPVARKIFATNYGAGIDREISY